MIDQSRSSNLLWIYGLGEYYITHGEMEISKIDKNGNIVWQFGGSDIFVSLDQDNAFKLNNDSIKLIEFIHLVRRAMTWVQ